jgi:hypothetical protein
MTGQVILINTYKVLGLFSVRKEGHVTNIDMCKTYIYLTFEIISNGVVYKFSFNVEMDYRARGCGLDLSGSCKQYRTFSFQKRWGRVT